MPAADSRFRFFATRHPPPARFDLQDIVIYNEDSDMHAHSVCGGARGVVHLRGERRTYGPWLKPGTTTAYTKQELLDNAANGTWMPVSLVIARRSSSTA